jgi:hypothetical protein
MLNIIIYSFSILLAILTVLALPALILFGLAFKIRKFFKQLPTIEAYIKKPISEKGFITVSNYCYFCHHHFYISMPYIFNNYITLCPYCKKRHYI